MITSSGRGSARSPLLPSGVRLKASDLHLSLGNAQVQVAQDPHFAVRSTHVAAADGKVLLARRRRSLQISLHAARVLELTKERQVSSKEGLENAEEEEEEEVVRINTAQPGTTTDPPEDWWGVITPQLSHFLISLLRLICVYVELI